MLHIYQADSKEIRKEKALTELLKLIPESLHARALRYKFEEDAYNFVLGRILLKNGLEKVGLKNQLDRVVYYENGKPYLDTMFFNISHSEDMVVCAISDEGNLGIDIEKEKVIALEDFKTWWFTETEWESITNAKIPMEQFFNYWTRKESIIKAMGVNLSYLHEIEVDPNKSVFIEKGREWYLKDLDFGKGYYGALCTTFEVEDVEVVSVKM